MAAPLRLHFSPCCVSLCLLRSTFLWKPLPQRSQPNGLYPVCFLLCVMRLELWLNAFPHTWHLCGFSPEKHKWGNIFFLSLGLHVIQHQLRLFIIFTTDFHGLLRTIYAQVIYFPLDATTTIPLQICLFSTCLCGWKCASSCLTSGGTSSRSTGRGTAECRSGWAGASTGLTTFWNFCRIFCSRNFFPENVNRCGVFFFLVCFVLSHDFKSAQPALTEKQTWWQQDAASEKKVWTAGCGLKKKIKQKKSVWCYLRVHRFVLFQADCVSEGFAAHFARKRPGAAVRSADVDLQPVRSGKDLVERREMSCGRFWEKKKQKNKICWKNQQKNKTKKM